MAKPQKLGYHIEKCKGWGGEKPLKGTVLQEGVILFLP